MRIPDVPAQRRDTDAVSAEPHFTQASREVLRYLREHVPLGFWAVTRVENGRQTYLVVDDAAYGLRAGGSHDWDASFCIHMAAGETPRVAPDAQAVAAYAAAGVNALIPIGAYAGAPIEDADGQLFGAICGLDPAVQPDELAAVEPLLLMLSRLLSMALAADRQRSAAEQALLQARMAAEEDALTRVLSRRAWDGILAREEQRFGSLGDPTAVVVVDLDDLKVTNDDLGHAAGDALLVRAADAIRRAVRLADPVARIGGDEFAVLLRHCTEAGAPARAAAIRESLAEEGVRASVGVAVASVAAGLPAAVAAADEAMYREKHARRAGRR